MLLNLNSLCSLFSKLHHSSKTIEHASRKVLSVCVSVNAFPFQLEAQYGAEAHRHLFRCLFSHVDFSGDGKSSGKDFHQVGFLSTLGMFPLFGLRSQSEAHLNQDTAKLVFCIHVISAAHVSHPKLKPLSISDSVSATRVRVTGDQAKLCVYVVLRHRQSSSSSKGIWLGVDHLAPHVFLHRLHHFYVEGSIVVFLTFSSSLFQTLRPLSHLFPQLSKVLKLNRVQEVAFGLALLNSTNPETRSLAAQYLKQKLPSLVTAYTNPGNAKMMLRK